MARYFLECAYKGTRYSGFQVQENAITVQAEVEKAFATIHRQPVSFTGSSRTDAGVHALQNFFHFDWHQPLHPQAVYKMNAILPPDVVVNNLYPVPDEAHCRFDALSREYEYCLHQKKNPFLRDTSFHFPYAVDKDLLHRTADYIKTQTSFFAFCKTNTQVTNFNCAILKSEWFAREEQWIYNIAGNRFLRGMVRLLTATQLKVGRGILSFDDFCKLFEAEKKCGFSVPPHGLFLRKVTYPKGYFESF